MYQFPEHSDDGTFFRFDKQLVRDGTWAELPQAAKAVFPAIAAHYNVNTGEAFPSEETIAALSGVTPKTTRAGIKALQKQLPGFAVRQVVNARGQRKNVYTLNLSGDDTNRYFLFYKQILNSAMWYHLLPTAKALYPVMRTYAFFDLDTFEEYGDEKDLNDIDVDEMRRNNEMFRECYSNRQYDFCQADFNELIARAGVSRRSAKAAWDSLRERYMIKSPENGAKHIWKIYLKTPLYYKRDYINPLVAKRYGNASGSVIGNVMQ